MPIRITAKEEIMVGCLHVVQGCAPEGSYAAVFEDDGDTGYFYALDNAVEEQPILDAVHIYDVAEVVDKDKPSLIQIGWSMDGQKMVLLINGNPHAVFDFSCKRGYCRTGFPPVQEDGDWAGHDWNDSALNLFE